MSLSVAAGGSAGSRSPTRGTAEAAFLTRAPVFAGAVARLTGDERRDLSNGDRTLTHRLVLLAVLAGLLCAAGAGWRSSLARRDSWRPASARWSPQAGRSPPASFLPIV